MHPSLRFRARLLPPPTSHCSRGGMVSRKSVLRGASQATVRATIVRELMLLLGSLRLAAALLLVTAVASSSTKIRGRRKKICLSSFLLPPLFQLGLRKLLISFLRNIYAPGTEFLGFWFTCTFFVLTGVGGRSYLMWIK